MPHFNEHALELSIMELFQQEGYIYTNGEEVHKEVSDVLLRDDMRLYLRSRYKADGITPLEVESVLAKLTANVGFSLYEQNRHTYQLMTEGFSLKRENAALPDLFIEPIDFRTLSKILCKWKQDSVVSFFLYLDSVFKYKHKLVHNQAPV